MTAYHVGGRSTAAGLVNLVGSALGLILVAHIVFVLLHTDSEYRLVRWAGRTADVIAVWFVNLVDTGNATFSIVVNYGLAAVFWLVVTGAIARLLRTVG